MSELNRTSTDDRKIPIPSGFTRRIAAINGLTIEKWSFKPGMLYGGLDKWWSGGRRNSPHSGIDLCAYETQSGDINRLGSGIKVPVMYPGIVAAVIDDFMGKTVVIKHDAVSGLYTMLGHINPDVGIEAGFKADINAVTGTIAMPKSISIRPHLHVSIAIVPDGIESFRLDWRYFEGDGRRYLIDPLNYL